METIDGSLLLLTLLASIMVIMTASSGTVPQFLQHCGNC
jgi:hypothetical protein